MEQYKKIVLEAPEGMHYITNKGKNGELIIQLIPDFLGTFRKSDTSLRNDDVKHLTEKDTYFTRISKERREEVKEWLKVQKGETPFEKDFLITANRAIKNVNYDYWIANLEPSVQDGKIYYAEGQKAERGFSCEEWSYKAKEYAPGRGSRLSTSEELIVWYVWRIVKGFWTLDYIVNNSSSAGNYINAPNASKRVDKTGEKVCGGFKDGQGNTYKIVTSGSGFAIVGGCCMDYGDAYPVASVNYYEHRTRIREFGSGVVVLTK